MWNLPGPGLEPMSPALAGGFLTTAPPGKSPVMFYRSILLTFQHVIWSVVVFSITEALIQQFQSDETMSQVYTQPLGSFIFPSFIEESLANIIV